MTAYNPRESYVIQSGKKEGKSVEQLMFSDYGWILFMKNLYDKKNARIKNDLQKHVEWTLAQGKSRIPKMICPQCNKKTVSFFSYLGSERFGYSMSAAYTCCDDKECVSRLSAQGIEKVPTFLPITFSSITHFNNKQDQKRVAEILKHCFGLPKRLTKEVLFTFFSE